VSALRAWSEALLARRIPDEVLDAAPEPPWGFPVETFRRRAEHALHGPATPTTRRALEALPVGGSVLDVGCGAGATSLPLAARAGRIVGIDRDPEMLRGFRTLAHEIGAEVDTIEGAWPEAAARAPRVDVVVCGHVLYDTADLAPFVAALNDRASRRVLVELTASHPLAWTSDLWERFHRIRLPAGPTADDAQRALRELGVPVQREDRVEPARGGFERREDAVALLRRRLCLTPDRDAELEEALGDRLRQRDGAWSVGPDRQSVATLWWDVGPDAPVSTR
jgi:SAM-dependent methyltransferase